MFATSLRIRGSQPILTVLGSVERMPGNKEAGSSTCCANGALPCGEPSGWTRRRRNCATRWRSTRMMRGHTATWAICC